MYFAAYMDTVHVTRPRNLKQRLPSLPDLILRLPVSNHAGPGYIDTLRPHCVNHMLVGKLGGKEILLLASDDGDVTAYYTDLIAEELQGAARSTPKAVPICRTQPFFLENVGSSAWGLAIHQKSRLIAVSSNNREVTVFIHGSRAFSDSCYEHEYLKPEDLRGTSRHDRGSFPEKHGRMSASGSTHSRTTFPNSFRRVLRPGHLCHNIPSIAFADSCDDLAQSIIATDINGNLWLLDIWAKTSRLVVTPAPRGVNQMGWGVMVIPLSSFRHSTNFQGALGIKSLTSTLETPLSKRFGEVCLDIKTRLGSLEKMAGLLSYQESDDSDEDDISDEEEDMEPVEPMQPAELPSDHDDAEHNVLESMGDSDSSISLTSGARRAGRGVTLPDSRLFLDTFRFLLHCAHFMEDRTYASISKAFSIHRKMMDEGSYPQGPSEFMGSCEPIPINGAAILHTSQTTIQMVSAYPNVPRTACENFLVPVSHLWYLGRQYHLSRMCILTHIPELSLVVVASQNGRVAFLTPTRPPLDDSPFPITTFRLEAVLPCSRDAAPILGVAVAPLQQVDAFVLGMGKPGRWRLLVHEYDHTVRSCELSRDERFDLKVF
ncbi:pyridine nucleotide-disulfide oxidoreductase family protein [Rutstroemia sp. NJR-2017a BBW]|nr:pyridine nucleotide-disulfide oxidoreductase family protein [Rutstroemia sp. NJR-2017a BBW]